MAIETVGQQKYADLTAKRIKSLQTGMIIWISLFLSGTDLFFL